MIAKVIEVIEVSDILVGKGTGGDPCRRMTKYFSLDGELLSWRDVFDVGKVSPDDIVELK